MNDKQTQQYLSSPHTCPYCGLENLDSDRAFIQGLENEQKVTCLDCHNHWTDTYTLVDVEFNEDTPEAFSDERRQNYLSSSDPNCPFCSNQGYIDADSQAITDEVQKQNVSCEMCNNEWEDVYRLTGVNFSECEPTDYFRKYG